MCTEVTNTTPLHGSGRRDDGWFVLDNAVVYYDHPQEWAAEHALCIDLWGGGERLAVELDADSARALARTILATLGSAEALAGDDAMEPATKARPHGRRHHL